MYAGQRLGTSQTGGKTGRQNDNLQPTRVYGIHWYHGRMKSAHANLQRGPFLIPIWLTAIGAIAIFSVAIFALWVWFTANSTLVIVIRHAEKESVTAPDPPLSEAGQARAALLVRMFGETQGAGRLDAIYTSSALRNRMTAAPLAARLGIVPIVAPNDDPRALARRIVRENGGKRILVIGHVNTVPEIVAALSGRSDIAPIQEQEFDTMYIVTVPRIGHANVLRLSY
jgi:broad specificity phosphatase PhoE